jgi:DNA-binding response OmpR family regulator
VALSGTSVLIVEDQALIALDLQMAFEDANATVVGPAGTVADASRLVETEHIDIAILDANLPDGDISPVAEKLIERGVPFIIYTGVAMPLDLKHRHPDVRVFRKPTPMWRLIAEMGAMLPRKGKRG